MIVPEPWQRWQGWEMENSPWPCDSTPRPWQTGQTTGCVPGSAPVPRHVGQAACVATETGTCAPSTACSNESETVVSRSRPRSCAGRVRAPPPRPPWLKIPDRMSENEPKSAPAAPPAPPAPANGFIPPRSYFLRFSSSDRTS